MYEKRIETCANRIRTALKTRRMKQVELCQLAKVPESSLSLYLKGEYEPKQNRIYDMARVLNVSEAWLMGYDVPMEKNKPNDTVSNEIILTDNEKTMLNLFRQVPVEYQDIIIQRLLGALDYLKNQG